MSDSYNFPETISVLLNKQVGQCKNLALILDKYPPTHVLGNSQGKSEWLKRLEPNGHMDAALIESAYYRWYAMMSATHATLFNDTLDWRMVIGLGGETVLETDITLHHLYGIPFIPGSALKGLARAYAAGEDKDYYIPINRPKDERKPSMKEETDHPDILRIFGTQKEAGTVLFFDAMPLDGKATFVLDIMNPHYPEYYGGNKPPTNDQSPVPVTFLTVTNTTFTFALAPRDANKEQHVKDAELVTGWLQRALQKYGVGGKTSAGYGYFTKDISPTEPPQPQKTQESVAQTQTPTRPIERIRPRLPQFREGQEIRGSVVPLTEELRRRMPSDVKAILRYESFPTAEVVMAVNAEEAQSWKSGETRICIFEREERYDGTVVWVCKPRVKKDKDKKK